MHDVDVLELYKGLQISPHQGVLLGLWALGDLLVGEYGVLDEVTDHIVHALVQEELARRDHVLACPGACLQLVHDAATGIEPFVAEFLVAFERLLVDIGWGVGRVVQLLDEVRLPILYGFGAASVGRHAPFRHDDETVDALHGNL